MLSTFIYPPSTPIYLLPVIYFHLPVTSLIYLSHNFIYLYLLPSTRFTYHQTRHLPPSKCHPPSTFIYSLSTSFIYLINSHLSHSPPLPSLATSKHPLSHPPHSILSSPTSLPPHGHPPRLETSLSTGLSLANPSSQPPSITPRESHLLSPPHFLRLQTSSSSSSSVAPILSPVPF